MKIFIIFADLIHQVEISKCFFSPILEIECLDYLSIRWICSLILAAFSQNSGKLKEHHEWIIWIDLQMLDFLHGQSITTK